MKYTIQMYYCQDFAYELRGYYRIIDALSYCGRAQEKRLVS